VRVGVLVGIGVLMTVGVYGLVAGIVKLDDAGLYLSQRAGNGVAPTLLRGLGRGIVTFAPWLMKLLAIAGTAAMFLVGGGILAHGIPLIEHFVKSFSARSESGYTVEAVIAVMTPVATNMVVGIIAGALALAVVALIRKVWPRKSA
jgi:predicted DNA repair protein MutK